ncbi:MAG: Endonuclease/Exonuclease/phosphatase family protein [Bacteroidetes bacterium ADurb.Bin174]|jgi:endonuclease/exonuclease/phosphatase family metal-dependent hydrolase|nr:MAG: Endonuclease/Exonuclease/phosphatase family protein [Bacteroidetes bacterium ADurb.Bin174]
MKRIYLIGLIFLLGFSCTYAQQSDSTLTIMTYNLYRDLPSNTQNSRIPEFAKVIVSCDPDVVSLQEVRGISNLFQLSLATGLKGRRYNVLPFYGIGMLWHSRLGKPVITSYELKALRNSNDKEARAFMVAEFDTFYFIATHFSLDQQDRDRMVEAIISFAQSVSKPVYLAGDLNITPEDAAIAKFKANHFILLNDPTHHTFRSSNPDRQLDMILVHPNQSKAPTIIDRSTTEFPKDYLEKLSDHLPYWVKVRVK